MNNSLTYRCIPWPEFRWFVTKCRCKICYSLSNTNISSIWTISWKQGSLQVVFACCHVLYNRCKMISKSRQKHIEKEVKIPITSSCHEWILMKCYSNTFISLTISTVLNCVHCGLVQQLKFNFNHVYIWQSNELLSYIIDKNDNSQLEISSAINLTEFILCRTFHVIW